jgi:hypothetical protein
VPDPRTIPQISPFCPRKLILAHAAPTVQIGGSARGYQDLREELAAR